MSRIKINYTVGTSDEDVVEVGTYEYTADNVNESFISAVVKKSIKQMSKGQKSFISGILTVFVDRVRTYDVVFIGDPDKPIKPKIYKL